MLINFLYSLVNCISPLIKVNTQILFKRNKLPYKNGLLSGKICVFGGITHHRECKLLLDRILSEVNPYIKITKNFDECFNKVDITYETGYQKMVSCPNTRKTLDSEGRLHSYDDMPAYSGFGIKVWYKHGQIHRKDQALPLIIYRDCDRNFYERSMSFVYKVGYNDRIVVWTYEAVNDHGFEYVQNAYKHETIYSRYTNRPVNSALSTDRDMPKFISQITEICKRFNYEPSQTELNRTQDRFYSLLYFCLSQVGNNLHINITVAQ